MEATNILQLVELLVVGGAIAIILLKLPQRTLEKLGEYISPSWLSIVHAPIVWLGYIIYNIDGIWMFIGFEIVIFGAMLDRVDGRLAAVLDKKFAHLKRVLPKTFWEALYFRGSSEWGKVIDPAADKIAIAPIFVSISHGLYVQTCRYSIKNNEDWLLLIAAILIAAILFVDLLGTIIRMDVFKGIIRGSGATWAGKTKALLQWVWLFLHMPYEQGWIIEYSYEYMIFLNAFLAIVLALGIISLVTKMVSWGDSITKLFKHHVE